MAVKMAPPLKYTKWLCDFLTKHYPSVQKNEQKGE